MQTEEESSQMQLTMHKIDALATVIFWITNNYDEKHTKIIACTNTLSEYLVEEIKKITETF